MGKHYLERNRLEDSPAGKYRYEYQVQCRACEKVYWTKNYPSKQPRCRKCAGTQTYTPSRVDRKDKRHRGDGYITAQGYHLIFNGEKYVPAHRVPFPDIAPEDVVHHIDGDKLNNVLDNLVPLTKAQHREAHGSLERVSYLLIQAGLIEYDRSDNSYSISTSMKEFMDANPVNSGEPLTDGAEGNPEPSRPSVGRCNDYPFGEYTRSLVEAQDAQTDSAEGDDIVSSHVKA